MANQSSNSNVGMQRWADDLKVQLGTLGAYPGGSAPAQAPQHPVATPEPQQTQEGAGPESEPGGSPSTGLGAYDVKTQTTNPVAPSGRDESLNNGELEREIVPSRWEQFVTGLKQTSDASPIGFMPDEPGALIRGQVQRDQATQDAANGVLKIKPEEANKRFPGMPQPFTEPVDPYVAELQYNDFKHRQQLQEWKQRGGDTPFMDFTAGMVGGFADPLNAALGLATGGLSKAAGLATGFSAAGARNVFLQNLAINTATGIPVYLQERAEHQDVTLGGATTQAIEGAAGGTLFHYAAQGLGYGLKQALDFVKRTPIDIQMENLKRAIFAQETGTKIDISAGEADTQARASGQMNDGSRPYTYTTERLPENTHYIGVQSSGSFVVNDPNLGPGIQTSDNGQRMNNLASDGMGGGHVGSLKMPEDLKLFDLEKTASSTDPEVKKVMSALEEKMGIKIEPNDGESVKNVIDRIHDMATDQDQWHEAMGEVSDALKSDGYAGYEYVGRDSQNVPMDNRTHLFLADNRLDYNNPDNRLAPPQLADQRAEFGDTYQANEETLPRLSDSIETNPVEESMKPENQANYTPELEEQVHDLKTGTPLNSEPEYMDPFVEQQYKAAKDQLTKLAETSESAKEALETLRRSEANGKQEIDLMKQIAECAAEGIV